MDECLGEVAAELALADVELLGEESGGSAGRTTALEPARRAHRVALLVTRQGHPEPTEEERPFGLAQRTLVRSIAVDVLADGQIRSHRVQRVRRTGVVGEYVY